MKCSLCASLTFKFFIGKSTTKSNFLRNLAVSHKFGPIYKMCPKPPKTVLVIKRLFGAYFSFQRIVYWHFEENKLQWCVGNHKLLVFWLIHYWDWSFSQTRIFSHFSIDGPVQCCSEKAILIQMRFLDEGRVVWATA